MDSSTNLEVLYGFISGLRQRNLELHSQQSTLVPHGQSLAFGDALLRHRYMQNHLQEMPPQITVIGPTQAGKSTLINALLGTDAAKASPLAGFTRHAQGFIPASLSDNLLATVQSLLPDWQAVTTEQLSNDNLNSFTLSRLSEHQFSDDNFLLWDTPDFDSVNSRDYRATVPTLCAMADAIVLIVSKEKYADQSVWDTLQLIAPAKRPLFIIINKTSAENAPALKQAMQKKLDASGISYESIETLPYLQDELSQPSLYQQDVIKQLRTAILNTTQNKSEPAIKPWLEQYWNDWLTPLHAEIAAEKSWQESIEKEQQLTLENYDRDYLQQPHYAETLNKAIVRLLELLEIPMLATGLSALRQAITWPARKIGKAIKDQTRFKSTDKEADHESIILQESGHHFLVALESHITSELQEADTSLSWWKNLSASFTENRPDFEQQLDLAIKTHQQAFQPEIEEAANNLYSYLQEHPVTLNGLRTARVGADAAAILLAIKTGGLSLHDLALAPAFVAVTSFLTEGAVGQHMRSIESDLKSKQLESVRQAVYVQVLSAKLFSLPDHMQSDYLYRISEEELQAAENALDAFNG